MSTDHFMEALGLLQVLRPGQKVFGVRLFTEVTVTAYDPQTGLIRSMSETLDEQESARGFADRLHHQLGEPGSEGWELLADAA
jgi:hypothetical protein